MLLLKEILLERILLESVKGIVGVELKKLGGDVVCYGSSASRRKSVV